MVSKQVSKRFELYFRVLSFLLFLALPAVASSYGSAGVSLGAANTWTDVQTFSAGVVPSNKSVYTGQTICLNNPGYANNNGNFAAIVPDVAAHRITGNLTIEAWIRPTDYGTTKGTISMRDDDSASALPWFFYLNADGRLGFEAYGGTGSVAVYSTNTIPLNKWTHVAVRHRTSDNTVAFLFDGVTNGGNQSATFVGPTSTGFTTRIGCWKTSGAAGYQFNGDLAEVAYFNVAESDGTILGHVTTPIATNETGLVGLYRLNEGTGTTITDLSSTATNGTCSGRFSWNTRYNQ